MKEKLHLSGNLSRRAEKNAVTEPDTHKSAVKEKDPICPLQRKPVVFGQQFASDRQ